MTKTEKLQFLQMLVALKRISKYSSVQQIQRHSQRLYGLQSDEAIEMAYENVIAEAKAGMKHVRMPRD